MSLLCFTSINCLHAPHDETRPETWFTAFLWLGFAHLFPHLQSPNSKLWMMFHISIPQHPATSFNTVSWKVWELLCFSQGPATALALREASFWTLLGELTTHSQWTPSCAHHILSAGLPTNLSSLLKKELLTAQSVLNHGRKQYFLRD